VCLREWGELRKREVVKEIVQGSRNLYAGAFESDEKLAEAKYCSIWLGVVPRRTGLEE